MRSQRDTTERLGTIHSTGPCISGNRCVDLGSSSSQISGGNKIWAMLFLWLIVVLKSSPLPFVFPSRICCTSHVFNLLTWHSPSLHPFTFLTQPPVQLCSCGRVSLSFASVTIQCILGRTQPPHFTCPLLRRCLPVAPDCSPLKTAQSLVSLYVTLRILCENFSG